MSKVRAVAVTIVFMLCASVSYAQGPPVTFSETQQVYVPAQPVDMGRNFQPLPLTIKPSLMYVACWAKVPSHNASYFSATFQALSVQDASKDFRSLVTAQYGPVSDLQCAGNSSDAAVKDIVQQWKDQARAANNTVVEKTEQAPQEPVCRDLARDGSRIMDRICSTPAEVQAYVRQGETEGLEHSQ
jgi:hypothetical protein